MSPYCSCGVIQLPKRLSSYFFELGMETAKMFATCQNIYFAVLCHNTASGFHWIGWTELLKKIYIWQTSRINQNQWPVIWIENNTRDSIDTEERMAEIGIFDRTVPLRNSAAIYSDNNIEYVSSLSGADRSLSGRP